MMITSVTENKNTLLRSLKPKKLNKSKLFFTFDEKF